MGANTHATVQQARPGQYLTFGLGNQSYAVPIGAVREIIQVCEITTVPKTPSFVEGVINLRGKIIPVVDLKMKLGMSRAAATRQTCIIVIEAESGQVGIIVDQVNEVVDLEASQIEPSLSIGDDDSLGFLMGLGKLPDRVLILVDIVHTLSRENFLHEFSAANSNATQGRTPSHAAA